MFDLQSRINLQEVVLFGVGIDKEFKCAKREVIDLGESSAHTNTLDHLETYMSSHPQRIFDNPHD